MSRLTKKIELQSRLTDKIENHYIIECTNLFNYIYGRNQLKELLSAQDKGIQKLGELEDIEERLGIDLIEAIELCKQVNSKKVVYIKEKWGIDTLKIFDDLDIELLHHRLYSNTRGMYVSLDLYDCGKTWALTKEELK